jgi:septum site-determining protein MinC
MILNQTGFMQPNLAPQETAPPEKDAALSTAPPEQSHQSSHIFLKAEQSLIYLHLPPNKAMTGDWHQLWEQLQHRLDASQKHWPPNTVTYLVANDRLLDHRQLEQLDSALSEVNLQLKRVFTSRRQTAIAAVTAGYSVDQQSPALPLASTSVAAPNPPTLIPTMVEPLYLQTTLRSGGEVRHAGSVVIVGDVNPGSTIVADGSILVWGRLRGIAHAGASGDRKGQIMALQMEPTQLRIADQVARAPAKAPTQFYPEVAYIGFEGIRITRASEFAKQKSAS